MVEDAVVIVLFLDQGGALLLAFHRATDGAPQPARLKFFLWQIILRARPHHFGGKTLVVHRAKHDDRNARRLHRQQGDLRKTVVVRDGKFKEHGVNGVLPKPRQAGVDRRRGGVLAGSAAIAQQAGDVARETLILANQQNFQCFRFHKQPARISRRFRPISRVNIQNCRAAASGRCVRRVRI